ncbi:MAG: endonuclease Q family protein [Methanosarcina barkeri]|nr:endonuclease Q family protein [Methanosarcina sp. ERenArc_MAG2]MCO5381781.1 endonuclease Q family protein [Methanosarcina sp. ERenArc_MAG2]
MIETLEPIRTVETKKLHCLRCNYDWFPRDADKLPRTCAGCGSPYWDRPRRAKKSEQKNE